MNYKIYYSKLLSMFRLFFSLTLIILNYTVFGQNSVGIGTTTPDGNAILELSSQSQGLLAPRLMNSEMNTLATNMGASGESMLVYALELGGFYYWDGVSAWIPVGGSGSGWDILGNAGTTNGVNFLGTTDAQDLDIRTNNVIRHRFTQKGQLEVLNTGGSVFIGEFAGENDDLSNNLNVFVGSYAGNANTSGYNNIGIGFSSLYANSTGYRNVGIGYNALVANTTGFGNTAVGDLSLNANQTGNGNTGIGTHTLYNSNGQNNTALGYQASYSTTTGGYNTTMGYQAYFTGTTGTFNTNVGYQAGYSQLGSRNTHLGSQAGRNVDSSYANIYTGYYSGYNSSGSYNQVTGYYAGYGSSGQNNIISGPYAGYFSSGNYNIITGFRAGYNNTGSYNRFFGDYTGYNNTGNYNTFMGRFAGYNNTTGNYGIHIGYYAGRYNTTGWGNINLGRYAGNSNTTGAYNTNIGYYAGNGNVSDNYNINIGMYSGRYSDGGTMSIHMGYYAGRYDSTSNNVMIGPYSGYDRTDYGSNNTFIGNQSDASSPSVTNSTAIGYNAVVSASNRVKLGNNADIEFDGALLPNGNPGPNGFVLTSSGGGSMTWSDPATLGDNIYTTNGTLISPRTVTHGANTLTHNLDGTGDFQINDAGITKVLFDDAGNSYFSENIYLTTGNTAGANLIRLFNNTNAGRMIIYNAGLIEHDLRGNGNVVFNQQGYGYDFRVEGPSEDHALFVDGASNRVGVGVSAPLADLHVGNAASSLDGTLRIGSHANWYGEISYDYGIGDLRITNGNSSAATGADIIFATYGNDRAIITGTGRVGINTSTPDYRFSVSGVTNLNEDGTGVAMRVNGSEALWYDGTRFSWGFGGTENYMADNLGVGIAPNNSYALYTGGHTYGLRAQGSTMGAYIRDDGGTANVYLGYGTYGIYTFSEDRNRLSSNLYIDGNTTQAYTLYIIGNAWSNGGVWGGSDRRWKKNITDYNGALNKIMALRPVNYDYRVDEFPDMHFNEGNQIGFIAQEVETVIPEFVKTDDKGYKAVAYDKMSAVNVAAIQEQQIQIEDLKQENQELRNELEAIKKHLGIND